MRIREFILAIGIAVASAQLALAQNQIYNPTIGASQYSQTTLSPYLSLTAPGNAGTTVYGPSGLFGRRFINNEALRQLSPYGDTFSGYDLNRMTAYSAVSGFQQNAEDWVSQRIRETTMSPSGHPTGFLLANPYYRMPNQHSFLPYNATPTTGQQPQAR